MTRKDEMKEAGVGLGHAFRTFGKAFVRSAERVADRTGIAEDEGTVGADGRTVFSDGSWKQVGREFGKAFANAGNVAVDAAKDGIDKVSEKIDEGGREYGTPDRNDEEEDGEDGYEE